MKLRAVIYDLDGTLIDSRGDLADAVNAMLRQMGLPERDDPEVWSFVGEGAEVLVRRSLGTAQEDRLAEAMPIWRAAYGSRLVVKTRPYPGIREVLALEPSARAVLTNKPGGFAREILASLGLARAFARVVGGDEAAKKPDPTALLQLCKDLGARPGESLLVGDSPVDVRTGAAAGVPVCAVTWGFSQRAALAGSSAWLCDSVRELSELIRGLTDPPRGAGPPAEPRGRR